MSIEAKHTSEETPLVIAAYYYSEESDDTEGARVLLKNEASAEAAGYNGEMPLQLTAVYRCPTFGLLLLEHGANVERKPRTVSVTRRSSRVGDQ